MLLPLILSPQILLRLYTLPIAILVWPTIFNFWHSCALSPKTERQSARMSKNGLDHCGAEPFKQQQFGLAGIEGVKSSFSLIHISFVALHVHIGYCFGVFRPCACMFVRAITEELLIRNWCNLGMCPVVPRRSDYVLVTYDLDFDIDS